MHNPRTVLLSEAQILLSDQPWALSVVCVCMRVCVTLEFRVAGSHSTGLSRSSSPSAVSFFLACQRRGRPGWRLGDGRWRLRCFLSLGGVAGRRCCRAHRECGGRRRRGEVRRLQITARVQSTKNIKKYRLNFLLSYSYFYSLASDPLVLFFHWF
jgi:hypothetical protein